MPKITVFRSFEKQIHHIFKITLKLAQKNSLIIIEKSFDDLDAPPIRVTGKSVPMPYAANLEKLALPSVEEVVNAAKTVCYI